MYNNNDRKKVKDMGILINLIIFLLLSVILTFNATRLPIRYYYNGWLFKIRKWENGGKFYEDVFKVKRWKSRVPELADFIKSTFPKKHIKMDGNFISKYLTESCKAEFTHWCIILSSAVYLILEDSITFTYMFFIATALNIPFIIIQRYNRPRIVSIIKQRDIKLKV
jgi:glycosyl-4,4'-diaponeurosporenoate acyltransferase